MKHKLFLTLICIMAGQVLAIDLDGPWYTGSNNGTPYLSATDSSSFSWGQGEDGTATTASKGILWCYFGDLTLTDDGDTITLAFSVVFDDDVTGTSSTALRLGLFDNGGSTLESNLDGINTDPAFSSSMGYYAAWPVSASQSATLRSRTAGNNNPLSTTAAPSFGSAVATDALTSGVAYSATFSVARINETEYQVTATLNGVKVQSVSADTNISTFDSFFLLNTSGSGVGSMTFADMRILYNVQAHNPYPSSGEEDGEPVEPAALTLTWNTGLDADDPAQVNSAIKKHYLYMSTGSESDPNLYFVDEIPASGAQGSYGPLALDRGTTYLWLIEEGLDNGMGGVYSPDDPNNIIGEIWQFETLPSVPLFTTQPESLNLKEGDDAVFGITAKNPFWGDDRNLKYQWYKFVDGVNDEQLLDGDDYDGSTDTILTIFAADSNDEGDYFCRANIIGRESSEADSALAHLSIDRMIQHHTFDSVLTDSIGANHGAMSTGDPEYVDGEINQAIKCYGDRFVDIGMAFPNASEGGGLHRGTIAMWFNSSATTQESLMGTLNADDSMALNIQFRGNNRLRVLYRAADGTARLVEIDASTIRDGKWHHLILSYEAGPQAKLDVYIDGDLQNLFILSGGNPTTFTEWEFTMTVGNLNNRGTPSNQYIGFVDDLQVYNYPFDSVDAARLYTNGYRGIRT